MSINDTNGFWNKAILNYVEEVETLDDVETELDVDMLKAKQAITFTTDRKLYLQSYLLFQFSQQATFISRILCKISKNIVSLILK